MNTLLKINDITKAYNGKLALNNISFDINKSEILGVLGPNGAGKSTLFNILSGVVSADKGSVLFNDKDCAKKKIYKNALGIVPQDISLYGNMTVNENLKFIGKLYSVRGKLLSERIDELITQINLVEKRKCLVKNLSGGMKRRVNIAAALVHDPDLIIMDEPTVGVDPQNRVEIWNIIENLRKNGKSIIITSHYVDEIERLSDRIIFIDKGRLIANGTTEELIGKYNGRYVYTLEFYIFSHKFVNNAKSLPDVENVSISDKKIIINSTSNKLIEKILSIALNMNLEIKNIDIKKPNLEDVFFSISGGRIEK